MTNRAGYQPLSQSSEEDISEGVQHPVATSPTSRGAQRQQQRQRQRARPGHIDLSKLDAAFKRWTEAIAQKMKRKKIVDDRSRKEILRSVFDPPVVVTSVSAAPVKSLDHKPPMPRAEFDILEQSVRNAINEGIHPKMIAKGSSGSYFARAKVDGKVITVAVFKPKDEEPYGRLNPKTTKWIHRQFRWLIPFGRSCLIPNLSYISEAAASLLDRRLHLHIVPRTELVSLASPAFFYDWLDRSAAKNGKRLPEKIGSMQYFLHGYRDASDFLRKHPWPGRAISDTFDDSTHRKGGFTKKFLSALKVICGKTGNEDELYDEDQEDEQGLFRGSEDEGGPFYWTQTLQQSFREELEKLVILDYLMLNTDRGADNYMIKYCEGEHEKPLVDVAPSRSAPLEMPLMSELRNTVENAPSVSGSSVPARNISTKTPFHGRTADLRSHSGSLDYTRHPHIHIAAIDNSLSFPHEHPQGWRSYTYGWLYLPVTIIGRPFSEKTRNHFLPLLTSTQWWEETTFQLRKLFAVDPDFHPRMFNRQLAVIKGQAWNIVQSLKHSDEGPLELTRRTRILVWDDEVEVAAEDSLQDIRETPRSPTSQRSIFNVPVSRTKRSLSSAGDFPPPPTMRRTITEGGPRPVPFVAKFQRVHPGTTGVTVLEHLERLDAVEASLKRLGVDDSVIEEEEEEDVAESQRKPNAPPSAAATATATTANDGARASTTSPKILASQFPSLADSGTLPPVPENDLSTSMLSEGDEEDLVAMSKSTSHVEFSPRYSHGRWSSNIEDHVEPQGSGALDWMHSVDGEPLKRTVIAERLETVNKKPLCSCW